MIQQIVSSDLDQSSGGISRAIAKNAQKLIFETLTVTQYTKPEESTIRELVSNAIDSQREKEIALKILTGEAEPKDYFIFRTGDLYKDSQWTPDYYNPTYLSSRSTVEIDYYEGEQLTGYGDSLVITDHGVGIGDQRLLLYFKLGGSTKRNTLSQLGSFGLGAKVSLSLRNDYYTLETCHNGKLFKFNCFVQKVESLIGKFNSRGEENPFITLQDDVGSHSIYYERTTRKNETKITIPLKAYHRKRIVHAVQDQLLYFNNIIFTVYKMISGEAHLQEVIDVKAEILYNSPSIIISKNEVYNKPHIIVVKGDDPQNETGVCYGYINFSELELEDYGGGVGIKCPIRATYKDDQGTMVVLQEGVSVTPSRESIIFDEHTRAFLLNRFTAVRKEATAYIQTKTKEVKNLKEWLDILTVIVDGTSDDPLIEAFSGIVELSEIPTEYPIAPSIVFQSLHNFFKFHHIVYITKRYRHGKRGYANYVERQTDRNWGWNIFTNTSVYLLNPKHHLSPRKDAFLLETQNNSLLIIKSKTEEELKQEALDSPSFQEEQECLQRELEEVFQDYSTISVPEDFRPSVIETETPEEEGGMSTIQANTFSQEQLDETLHLLQPACYSSYNRESTEFLRMHRTTWTVQELLTQENSEKVLYYGFHSDRDKLLFAFYLFRKRETEFSSEEFIFREIQSNHQKYFRHVRHIDQFFDDYKNVPTAHQLFQEFLTVQTLRALNYSELNDWKSSRLFSILDKKAAKDLAKIQTLLRTPGIKATYEQLEKRGLSKGFCEDLKIYCTHIVQICSLQHKFPSAPEEVVKYCKENGLPLELCDHKLVIKSYLDKAEDLFNQYLNQKDWLNITNLLEADSIITDTDTPKLLVRQLKSLIQTGSC